MLKLSSLQRMFLIILVSLFAAIACSPQLNPTSKPAPIVVGTSTWAGYSGHFVAVGKNFFTEQGLSIKDKSFNNLNVKSTIFPLAS
jgi:NitT/TauT family transport system substrate-binding protein